MGKLPLHSIDNKNYSYSVNTSKEIFEEDIHIPLIDY